MRSCLLLGVLCFCGLAQAAPVSWELNGVTFDDGTSASGWFIYDSASGSYQDFSISVEYASPYGGGFIDFEAITYNPGNSVIDISEANYGGFSLSQLQPGTDPADLLVQKIILGFAGLLNDSGGVVQLAPYNCEAPCTRSSEQAIDGFNYAITRGVVSGSVSAVPLPAAVWLFGSALAGLCWLRRKPAA